MELEPRTLFLIVVGAPVALIVGMGIMTAVGLYLLDRAVRRAQVDASAAASQSALQPTSPAPAAPAAALKLAPLSRRLTADGVVEPPPTMGLPSNKLGMWIFLASEVMFFTALIAAFVSFRVSGRIVPPPELNVPLSALNTFILIVSSFTIVLALEAIQHNRLNRFVLMLLATLGLGSIFIGIQGYEWNELLSHGVTPTSDLFGTAFFVLTGFHGLHVIIGLIVLVFLLLKAFRGDYSPRNNLGIELFGLYWHFVDIVWILLFTIIYLI